MKQNYIYNVTDEFCNETILTEEGRRDLMRLEKIYISSISLGRRKKYLSYSEVDKLKSLLRKDKREKKKNTTMKEKRTSFTLFLVDNDPEIQWFILNYNQLQKLEHFLIKNLENCWSAKELILDDIKKDLSAQMEQC